MVRTPSPVKIFWALLLLEAAIIVINGSITPVSLGDESHHYRFAQNIYNTGKRAPFDPLYESGNPPGFFNNDPPLWHFGLAFLWRIAGGMSQTIAQLYHILFLILLLWITSLLAKEFTGKEEGGWVSALITATVPMVVSFSTLLYVDIPMAVLSTLSFYFILKKRYIEAGVSSGLAYFTKLNAGFLFPAFLFIIFWNERRKILNLLKSFSFFLLPILLIYIPDFFWRSKNITSQFNIIGMGRIFERFFWHISEGMWSRISERTSEPISERIVQQISKQIPEQIAKLQVTSPAKDIIVKEFSSSNLTNSMDLIKYLGVVFLFLLLLHIFRFRRWERKDLGLWVPVISYLIVFLIVFGVQSDLRYLVPVFPFLAVLVTPSFLSLRRSWRWVLIGVCILQFASTSFYVHQKRQISPGLMEGFEFIKNNVPESALILYPEENLLIYAQRRVIWSAVKVARSGPVYSLRTIFWGYTEETNYALGINKIDHILIKKSRIYDDREVRHFGGYPKSFVEKLPHLNGWVKIFENPEVELWKNESINRLSKE